MTVESTGIRCIRFRAVGALLLLAGILPALRPSHVFADEPVTLQVRRGWNEEDRLDRWNPILLRLSDPTPRNALARFIAPTADGFETIVEQDAAVGPTPATYELFAPLRYSSWRRNVLVLRDADSGRVIGENSIGSRSSIAQAGSDFATAGARNPVIAVAGRMTELTLAAQALEARVVQIPIQYLPRSPTGYDCVDILFLNRADFGAIRTDQARAILDWVHAGGALLAVPGDASPPPDNPLLAAMPCGFRPIMSVRLSDATLRAAGLVSRDAQLTGRELAPRPGASPVPLLPGTSLTGWTAASGLGRITVCPIDPADLEFNEVGEKETAARFWNPILRTLVTPPKPLERGTYSTPYYGYQSETADQRREGAADLALREFLIPQHAPPRDWFALGLPLLAVLTIVGPVDSIVLRLNGRHPWMWTTALGWIGLIAVAAFCAAGGFRQDRVTFGSVRLIDQAGDRTVAETALIGVESSRGGRFRILDRSRDDWWEPLLTGPASAAETGVQSDLIFHENDRSCRPKWISVAAGRPRFLRSESRGEEPPMISADLSGEGSRLTGVIRNLSTTALRDIRIRTRLGVVRVPGDSLAPGAQVRMDLPIVGEPFVPSSATPGSGTPRPITDSDLWAVASDLSGRRSLRVDERVEGDASVACVYARCEDASEPIRLRAPGVLQRNFQWLRAVITLRH